MKSLLVFRPINLLIIACLQAITYFYLDLRNAQEPIFRWALALLILGSILVTAGGYLFNDYIDKNADRINKPNKVYIDSWSSIGFWLVYLLFNALALLIFFILSSKLFFWYAIIIIGLIIYSLILKRLPLIGNIFVSALAAFSIIAVFMLFQFQNKKMIVLYAGLAALLTYIREIIKDIEDISGDKATGYKTFPVLVGQNQSKMIVIMTVVFTMIIYGNLLNSWVLGRFTMPLKGVFIGYQVVCIFVPLLVLTVKLYIAESKEDFGKLSSLTKYIMATGMLAMLFF